MKKYTMLVDGHNFLFKTLYTFPVSPGKKLLGMEDEIDTYCSQLVRNLASVLKNFQDVVDTAVFVLDSSSWRKDVGFGIDYKGNRNTEENVNFANFSICVERFCKELSRFNITVSKSARAEADDLLFLWACKLTESGTPVIVNSSDEDMCQLVGYNGQECETLVYSQLRDTKKLYVPNGFLNKLSEPEYSINDVFETSTVFGFGERYEYVNALIRRMNVSAIEISAVRKMACKVLSGDRSDNIPSVYTKTVNEKKYGITETKANLIVDEFEKTINSEINEDCFFADGTVELLGRCVQKIMKTEEPLENICGSIRRNAKLIILSSKTIPEDVLDGMNREYQNCRAFERLAKINFAEIQSKREPVVKMTIGALGNSKEDEDFSFIKNNSKLF